jgi:hypothetical protein
MTLEKDMPIWKGANIIIPDGQKEIYSKDTLYRIHKLVIKSQIKNPIK